MYFFCSSSHMKFYPIAAMGITLATETRGLSVPTAGEYCHQTSLIAFQNYTFLTSDFNPSTAMDLMRAAAIQKVSQANFSTTTTLYERLANPNLFRARTILFLQLSEIMSVTIRMVNAATAAMLNASVYHPHLRHSHPFQ